MRETVFLIILLAGLNQLGSSLFHQYHFVNIRMNWTEAQSYCRETYTDLATITNPEELSSLNILINSRGLSANQAWIGLKYYSWRWSLEDTETDGIINGWPGGYPWSQIALTPDMDGLQECAYVQDGVWVLSSCNSNWYFVCYDGRQNATQTFVLVKENKTWYEAQSYCRDNYTDLAIVRNQTDYNAFRNLSLGLNVWIGLYFDATWSDNSSNYYVVYNTIYGQSCATAKYQNPFFEYKSENCNNTFAFVCYSVMESTTTPQMQPATTVPQTLSSNGSEYIIVLNAQVSSLIPLTDDNVLSLINDELTSYGLSQNFNVRLIEKRDVSP
ncbi:hypothetical protein UPYG_G00129750 [Umbra pygmaea]|uniref:C-type lectin domain-containing protein n=1 Tax=Umbra pygmaea TaxID=75934 RepID=A0ABD0XW98_UMBPY